MLVLNIISIVVYPVVQNLANVPSESDHSLPLGFVLEGRLGIRSMGEVEAFLLGFIVLDIQRVDRSDSESGMPN